MTKLTAKNWRKEFDNKFTCIVGWEKWPDNSESQKLPHKEYVWNDLVRHNPRFITDFIFQLLQAVIKDLAGEIKKNITSSEFNYIDGYGQMRLNIPKFLSFIEEVLERGELWIK